MTIPAVLYAAKSTEDRHGSIGTQLADGRALAEREGLNVVAEYQDEAASAFKGNRGPELARAKAHAERLGAVIIVQHSDRLARGDGGKAQHLVEHVLWARQHGVTLRSVQDPQTFDSMGLVYAALMGDRNHEDSARKSAATRDGLKRRAERGQAVGAIPLGYRAGRIVDEQGAALYERIVIENERGLTPGQTSRGLNQDGHVTVRGKPWTTRAVRRVLESAVYVGESGYPALTSRERWDAVQGRLSRLDSAATQARKGGRPANGDVLLAGVAFCGRCGAPMRHRRVKRPGRVHRYYRCRNTMEGIGTCKAKPVRADVAESRVLLHLTTVVGEQLTTWLAERATEHERQRDGLAAVVERERARLQHLHRRHERAVEHYRHALDALPELADTALEQVAAINNDVQQQERCVGDAEARAAEFAGAPDEQAAADHLAYLAALFADRLKEAQGGAEINALLRDALEGIWMTVNNGTLHVGMRARTGVWAKSVDAADVVKLEGAADIGGPADWLRRTEAMAEAVSQTGPQTFVYVQPHRRPISS